jgi:hypothetical protein
MKDKDQWFQEFREFSEVEEKSVPSSFFEGLKSRLFPSPWKVFAKVLGLHLIVGFLSLGICHQFGLNPLQTNRSLADWFMNVGGHNFCMTICGAFFVGFTFFAANLFLTLEVLETVRRTGWLQTGAIGLFSLVLFVILGAELVALFVALWAVGAFLGGLFSIELGYRVRRSLAIS